METHHVTSPIHIHWLEWTERETNPHRRHRIEIDATTARCLVRCEHGFHEVARAERANADELFPTAHLPENFAGTLLDMMEMERKTRAGEPIGEPYEEEEGPEEPFEQRLKRIAANMGPEEDQYVSWDDLSAEEIAEFDRMAAESLAAEAERERIARLPNCPVCGVSRARVA